MQSLRGYQLNLLLMNGTVVTASATVPLRTGVMNNGQTSRTWYSSSGVTTSLSQNTVCLKSLLHFLTAISREQLGLEVKFSLHINHEYNTFMAPVTDFGSGAVFLPQMDLFSWLSFFATICFTHVLFPNALMSFFMANHNLQLWFHNSCNVHKEGNGFCCLGPWDQDAGTSQMHVLGIISLKSGLSKK